MKKEIQAHFKEKYDIDDVEYISPAFDIADYFEVVKTLGEL